MTVTPTLEAALQYAGRGWPVFPVSFSKVPFKSSRGFHDASTDSATVTTLFQSRKRPNVALATGRIVVFDCDGQEGLDRFLSLGRGPPTLVSRTPSGGWHFFYYAPEGVTIRTRAQQRREGGHGGLDIKAQGGFVLLPPSRTIKGSYSWANDVPIIPLPDHLLRACEADGRAPSAAAGPVPPDYLIAARLSGNGRLNHARLVEGMGAEWTALEAERIAAALNYLDSSGYDDWLRIGFSLHSLNWVRPDGTDAGFELWDQWSRRCEAKYNLAASEQKWTSFGQSSYPHQTITVATLFHLASEAGWDGTVNSPDVPDSPQLHPLGDAGFGSGTYSPPPDADRPDTGEANGTGHNPFLEPDADRFTKRALQDFNKKYAVIGDLGGKCVVMGWTHSHVRTDLLVPSFQSFRAFTDRFANRYIKIQREKPDGTIETKQEAIGAYWLKWKHRKTYEGLELIPNGPPIVGDGILNLWRGFAVSATAGRWDILQHHIYDVLAQGHQESADYIYRFAAWCVQHPGERPEVALVLKGDKGTGKSTFANMMVRLFGAHGLQVYSSKHLIGAFNGHLRNCLLLFADEAFWAGDVQGQSVLKGMLTEPELVIESKGFDAIAWHNQLHIIMAANADWVVPASHDERRYAVFEVGTSRREDRSYFNALYAQMKEGGLSAMLYDLLRFDLGSWHPREIVRTEALQKQKEHSLDPRWEWWLSLLEEGHLPWGNAEKGISLDMICRHARETTPRLKDKSDKYISRALKEMGWRIQHSERGNSWFVPVLGDSTSQFIAKFGNWQFPHKNKNWT